MSSIRSNYGKKWTENEDSILRTEVKRRRDSGGTIGYLGWKEIGKRLKRTADACKSRWNRIAGEEDKDKMYKDIIQICNNISFRYCGGSRQTCTYCGNKITGEYGISMRQVTGGNVSAGQYNIWFHLRCFKKAFKEINEVWEENEEFLEERKAENMARSL